MTLAVLGAGFGRTGTLSLQRALETLGFAPCYHMVEVARHPEHAKVWSSAARGEPVDWHAFFRNYTAAVDWPATAFWRELASTFPTARIVLTVRDSAAWYERHARGVYAAHNRGVIDAVPPERLLVYDMGEGWAPLCAFLERPIPSEPFPHLTSRTNDHSQQNLPAAVARSSPPRLPQP